jgi:TetR/AcrR family transcriptional regulator, ethionamide resistance regulator
VATPERQTTEKRAAIEASVLEATEALLSEGLPFAELNIEKIAKRAGISRTAFYFYFRDKREVLERLTAGVNQQLVAAASSWWSGDADIREALAGITALYREHSALMRATVEVATYDEELATFWRALLGEFVTATRERIEADQRAGRALPIPADATAMALTWMVERCLYEQLVQHDPVDPADLIEALALIYERSVYGTT